MDDPADPIDPALVAVLQRAQGLGILGDRAIPEVIDHARAFCRALVGVHGRIVDLGSGAGVPGLIIAHDRADLHVTLLDRRTKRTDAAERAVRSLGWSGRVEVVAADADEYLAVHQGTFQAAVARGFGPAEMTLATSLRAVEPGGLVVISEPPAGTPDRWPTTVLDRYEVGRIRSDTQVAVFFRRS